MKKIGKTMKRVTKTAISMLLVVMLLCTGLIQILATTEIVSEEDTGSIFDALKDNLLLYSNFDDETVNDVSGKGHNGEVVGEVSYVNGISGKAVFIDGNDLGKDVQATNYVNYGASNAIIPDTGDFSVSMFFRASDALTVDKGLHLLANKDASGYKNVGFSLVADSRSGSSANANVASKVTSGYGTAYVNARVYDSNTEHQINDLTWHMLTATFDRDGHLSYYVDGKLVEAVDISAYSSTSLNCGKDLVLGADGDKKFGTENTEIDELRIYGKALTNDEVLAMYETYMPKFDVNDGLLLYSNFDDETVNDASGKGRNGTVVGSVSYVNGISGKAVLIDGNEVGNDLKATNYVNYGASSGIIPDTGDFSVSMFFKASGEVRGNTALFGNKDYTSGKNQGFVLMANANGSTYSQMVNYGTGSKKVGDTGFSEPGAADGDWHMLTMTFDRDGYITFYIDADVSSKKTLNISGYASVSMNPAYDLILGADGTGYYGTENSIVDELRIYNKVLSEDEIGALYEYTTQLPAGPDTPFDITDDLLLYSSFDGENANDESIYGHHGTVVDKEGYEVEYVDGVSGKAIHIKNQENSGLDNAEGVTASTYVNYGPSKYIIDSKSDFSFSMFFRASASIGEIGENTVLFSNKDYTKGLNNGFTLIVDDSPNSTSQRLNFGTGVNNNITNSSKPGAADGKWHMLTATFDRDGKYTFYIDGVKIGEADISAYKDVSVNTDLPLILGADGTLGYGTKNSIVDELRVYGRALTADDVAQLYASTAKYVSVDNGESITYYDSLNSAIDVAESGDVVKLLVDIEEANVTVPTGIVLDLNGKALTVDTLYAEDGAAVVDTSVQNGRLTVNTSATLKDTDNSYGGSFYVAMKLDGDNTYAFVPMLLQAKATATSDSTMSVKIRPAVKMGEDISATTNGLFGNGAADNGLSFAVRVNWTTEDGTDGSQTLTFADSLIAEAYTAGMAITLDMSGIPANTALSVDLVIASDLGAETVSNLYTK